MADERRMIIEKYIPDRLFGFVSDGDLRLYFHVASFDPGPYVGESPVPPVIGEAVDVATVETGNKALRVTRITPPVPYEGVVDWFDVGRGYGYANTECGNFYLHRSEVQGGRLPVSGRRVHFYVAENNKRACHIRVESS